MPDNTSQPKEKTTTGIVAKENDIEIIPEAGQNLQAEALIQRAIDNNVPVESLERLLAMRRELKAEWAKEQYNRAMSNFQAECPTIVKTKQVKTNEGANAYKYAPLESIVEQVKGLLNKNGFSYSTVVEVLPAGVKAVVKVTHVDGHSEESPMEVPLGSKTKIMSDSQVTAAASTFAKRYAFCNAFGILTGDEDNDGQTDKLHTTTKGSTVPNNIQTPEAKYFCSVHGDPLVVQPAGTSKQGKKFNAFWKCNHKDNGSFCKGPFVNADNVRVKQNPESLEMIPDKSFEEIMDLEIEEDSVTKARRILNDKIPKNTGKEIEFNQPYKANHEGD